jgi:O-6-methylguanine DNA methyltransferase
LLAKQIIEQVPDLLIATPWGPIAAWFSDAGLARLALDWRGQAPEAPRAPGSGPARLQQALERYFSGGQTTFDAIPLDVSGGTPFQKQVWRTIRGIPWGETWTYGTVAQRVGKPGAARAVGQAVGANPVPIIVPCHRVVGANGLGGFSGGLSWKKRLLGLEKAAERPTC